MKTIKTSIEKTENGISLYQLNEYGHQRIFLTDEDIQVINRLHQPQDDEPEEYAADFMEL